MKTIGKKCSWGTIFRIVRTKHSSDSKGREADIGNWDQFLNFAENIPSESYWREWSIPTLSNLKIHMLNYLVWFKENHFFTLKKNLEEIPK